MLLYIITYLYNLDKNGVLHNTRLMLLYLLLSISNNAPLRGPNGLVTKYNLRLHNNLLSYSVMLYQVLSLNFDHHPPHICTLAGLLRIRNIRAYITKSYDEKSNGLNEEVNVVKVISMERIVACTEEEVQPN